MAIVTIRQRQLLGGDRLLRAAAAVRLALHAYAQEQGGRFIIFGSVARNEARHDSDLDIAVDFPAPLETAAWYFAEQRCIEHGVPPDVHMLGDLRQAVRDRAIEEGDVVI